MEKTDRDVKRSRGRPRSTWHRQTFIVEPFVLARLRARMPHGKSLSRQVNDDLRGLYEALEEARLSPNIRALAADPLASTAGLSRLERLAVEDLRRELADG